MERSVKPFTIYAQTLEAIAYQLMINARGTEFEEKAAKLWRAMDRAKRRK